MAKLTYKHTLSACFIGYITQAIVNNFAPLLFLTFQTEFSIGLDKITMLVTINFVTQLIVDMLSAKVVDKIGYKPCIVAAHVFCATGLIGLALFPGVGDPYAGLLIAVVLYAIGGGLIEVLVSPIAEACPTTDKTGAMSLLHSFYCWGSAAVILVTTLLLLAIGSEHWRWLAVGWAAVPIFNAIYYGFVPVGKLQEEEGGTRLRTLFSSGTFWLFAVMMLCAGASELSMSQWASAFAESGLGISKTMGDLFGPCLFAVLMGVARVLYARFGARLNAPLTIACSCVLCVVSYLLAALSPIPALGLVGCALCGLSVGIFWPATFSLAIGRDVQPCDRANAQGRHRAVRGPFPRRRRRLRRGTDNCWAGLRRPRRRAFGRIAARDRLSAHPRGLLDRSFVHLPQKSRAGTPRSERTKELIPSP